MGPVLHLIARIAESELRRHSSRDDGGHGHDDDHDGDDDDGNGGSGIEWWGILIIVYVVIILLVFSSSFIYFWRKDRENRRNGRGASVGRTTWKAVSVATGLWVWNWVFTTRGWCGASRKEGAGMDAGPYAQLDARRARADMGRSPSTPRSTHSHISRPTTPARYGAPVNHAKPYAPYGQPGAPPKSPGYSNSKTAVAQQQQQQQQQSAYGHGHHESIPMKTMSPPVPSPSPSPSPSPNPNPSHALPPPYMSSPPAVELHGDDIQPNSTGTYAGNNNTGKYTGRMY